MEATLEKLNTMPTASLTGTGKWIVPGESMAQLAAAVGSELPEPTSDTDAHEAA